MYRIQFVIVFSIALIILTTFIGCLIHKEYFNEEPDGNDANSQSCISLLNASISMKNFPYDKFNDNAKSVATMLDPGMSSQLSEFNQLPVVKSRCMIPKNKFDTFGVSVNDAVCTARTQDNTVNVTLPYVKDTISGCAININDKTPQDVEAILSNLYTLRTEKQLNELQELGQRQNTAAAQLKTLEDINARIQDEKKHFDDDTLIINQNNTVETDKLNKNKVQSSVLSNQQNTLKALLTSSW